MTSSAARYVRIAWGLVVIASVLVMRGPEAGAENGRGVYLPMVFNTEGRSTRTSACLKVTERAYPQTAWWTDSSHAASASERALQAVVAAIRRGDRAALHRLSHPTLGRDPKQFDVQAGAYIQQFAAFDLVEIPRAYEFDGLAVFFGKFRFKEQSGFAPLIFAAEDDGSFGFLPYRTEAVTYRLVEDWFNWNRRPAAAGGPGGYCGDDDIRRATHRISLGMPPGASSPTQQASSLFLRGGSFDRPGDLHSLAMGLRSTIASMKAALAGGRIHDFAAHLTPRGAKRLEDWYGSASQLEREQYEKAFTEQQPFFVFDMSSVAVVYTTSPAGLNVMYFAIGSGTDPLWANSSYITDSDGVFRKGRLYEAAREPVPFSSIAIK